MGKITDLMDIYLGIDKPKVEIMEMFPIKREMANVTTYKQKEYEYRFLKRPVVERRVPERATVVPLPEIETPTGETIDETVPEIPKSVPKIPKSVQKFPKSVPKIPKSVQKFPKPKKVILGPSYFEMIKAERMAEKMKEVINPHRVDWRKVHRYNGIPEYSIAQ